MANENKPKKKAPWKKWIFYLATPLLLFYLGDGIHALYVARSASHWETEVERDPQGVLIGCEAYLIAAEGEATQDTALLLLHGINASPRHYDKIAPELVKLGYSCRAMRLPGFAEPLETYEKTTSQSWIEAVHSELEQLREKHDRVGLVAHSLGGAVAISSLLDKPDAANFVVLLGPAIKVSDQRAPLLSTRAWHEFATHTFLFTDMLYSPFGMDVRDPEINDWPGRTPFTPIQVVEELYGLMDANKTRATEFHTPALMVLSQKDRFIDTPACQSYYQAMQSTPKSLQILKQSGHAIPVDLDWQEVVGAIDQFARLTNAN